MVEEDTIKLLRECDAGVKMGIASIDEVMDHVQHDTLKECLNKCKDEHDKLKDEIQDMLERFHDQGKEPNPMAKGMSWFKTNARLAVDESAQSVATLITDG